MSANIIPDIGGVDYTGFPKPRPLQKILLMEEVQLILWIDFLQYLAIHSVFKISGGVGILLSTVVFKQNKQSLAISSLSITS